MKKVLLFAALTGLFLTSCSNEDFCGTTETSSNTNEIGFAMNVPNLTRATVGGAEAAQKLNNNFVVYGFKYSSDEEQADGSNQQIVFGRYNVNYEGNAGGTKTNTKGWEYVGYTSLGNDPSTAAEQQTMKYWDYTAKGYVFSAIAGTGVTPVKIPNGTTVYDKGWNVTIPAGGSISDLYASSRVPVAKTAGSDHVYKYPETVTMTFYSMATKIRFAIYETVPGYSIHIDKFYCKGSDSQFAAASNSTTNFGINGKFLTPNVASATTLKVTYYDAVSGIENRPKVTFDETTLSTGNTYSKLFGTNIPATAAIGETSVEATYDQANGAYTFILPYQNADNKLELYVDYTLKAPNGETIKVSQAKATVPANYTQWKENFAYTYLFKISDNTNGTTGKTKDPDDPTKPWDPTDDHDPEGLYPITFDACIVNAEDGIQETVTTVATPSITTYQNGVVATANDTYTAGDIYYTSCAKDGSLNDVTASKVYEVYYTGTNALTEALVADYAKNEVSLISVTTTPATTVPCSDGTTLKFADNKCYMFTAVAGKTYAIYTNEGWKVVKVAGTYTAPTFTLTGDASAHTISTQDGTVTYTLTSGTALVTGAQQNMKVYVNGTATDVTDKFIITDEGAGVYKLQLKNSAIQEGIAGNFDVKFVNNEVLATGSCALVVDLAYGFANYGGTAVSGSTISVIAGKSANFQIIAGSQPLTDAVITNTNEGIKITENSGVYTVEVATTVAAGNYNTKIAGQTLTVAVTSYSFDPASFTLTWAESAAAPTQEVVLKSSTGATPVAVTTATAIESSNPEVFANTSTDADGKFTFTPLKGGKTTLSYENGKCEVTVNQYELKTSNATIAKATGVANLTFWKSGEKQNATTETTEVLYGADYATAVAPTGNYSLTSNGASLTFKSVAVAGTYWIKYWNAAHDVVLGFEKVDVVE